MFKGNAGVGNEKSVFSYFWHKGEQAFGSATKAIGKYFSIFFFLVGT